MSLSSNGMTLKDYTSLAEIAWDEAAIVHWRKTENLVAEIKDPHCNFLFEPQRNELIRCGIEGASVAQLNCNNGRELISAMRLGAAGGVGFDISIQFVQQAELLAESADTKCMFLCSDIYDIDSSHNELYDIVFVTAGVLCFMPDLTQYFGVAARLLRTGGRLNLFESHPIAEMFLLDRDRKGAPPTMVHPYFDCPPTEHTSGLDYIANTTYDGKPIYYFHHKLDDIFDAVLKNHLKIEKFEEHEIDPSQALTEMEKMAVKPPLSFLLTARK